MKQLGNFLFLLFFSLYFVFFTLPVSTNAEVESRIDNKNIIREPDNYKDDVDIDNLLGPKDNFPFLPDNHRDSGTGKFAAFD